MSEQVKRYGVVATWNDDCTEKIGSHIEESTDGIYCLVAEQAATITALDTALTEVCDERDKYHEDYTRLREALWEAYSQLAGEFVHPSNGPKNPAVYRGQMTAQDVWEMRERWNQLLGETAALKET